MPGPSSNKRKAAPPPISETSNVDEADKCIICNKFSPDGFHNKPFLSIVKWGCCNTCDEWVNLNFCTPVKIL